MPGVLQRCFYAAAISVQQLLLPLAGTLLALVLVWALVTAVLPSGGKRVPTPRTAADAGTDCLLAPSQLHASPARLQVSIRACGCGLTVCHHLAGAAAVDAHQPDTPGSADPGSSCDPSDSSAGGAHCNTGLADGCALIRKHAVQHPGSSKSTITRTSLGVSSLRPAMHSPPALVTAQLAAPSSLTANWQPSQVSSPAPAVARTVASRSSSSGAGARAGSPARGGSPAQGTSHYCRLRVQTSPSSGATTPNVDGRLAPASCTVTSPVGGLVVLGTTGAWDGAAHAAEQVASSSDGGGSSSSGQHSFTSKPLQLDATAAGVAAAAGDTPQAGPCSTCAAAHQPHVGLPEGCADASGASWPSSCNSTTTTTSSSSSSGSDGGGSSSAAMHTKALRRVRFAPLPSSKDVWLQQLRLMPAESKARFVRRLHSVARKVWCMWRQHSRRQQQQQAPGQVRQHGLKRAWQQAAAELGPAEEPAEAASPCKKATSQVVGFSASRMSTD